MLRFDFWAFHEIRQLFVAFFPISFLLLHNQAAAVVAKARGSYREAVHNLKILSDFYAQIEVKGVEALPEDQAASFWKPSKRRRRGLLESARSSPACLSALDVAQSCSSPYSPLTLPSGRVLRSIDLSRARTSTMLLVCWLSTDDFAGCDW
jgi:hypothetical protein